MIVLDGGSNCKPEINTYIALGSFDGLHLGHMSLINKVIELAKKNNDKSMIYTFKDHPLTVINKNITPKLIMDNETKINILDRLGIDFACMVDFDLDFMKMSPEEFIKQLKSKYNMLGVVVGTDFEFGYNNSGNIETLKTLGNQFDFKVYIMDALTYEDKLVSSSRIRNLIAEGQIELANKMLFQPFMLKGNVIHGKKLGRTMGFPTANVDINPSYVHPKTGVYYTNILINGELHKSITNIGFNPTVQGKTIAFESYILNFNSEIYGENIYVSFIERIRDEIKFNNLQQLIDQMNFDKIYAELKIL